MTVHKHGATLLPAGNVLGGGGSDARDGRGQYPTTEILRRRYAHFRGVRRDWHATLQAP